MLNCGDKDVIRRTLEPDLVNALMHVRGFRRRILLQRVHPVAGRIAIRFMDLIDEHEAKAKITPQTEIAIEEIAQDLYEQTLKAVKH